MGGKIPMNKERINLTLARPILERLKRDAEEQGFSVSVWIQVICRQYYAAVDALGTVKTMDGLMDKMQEAQRLQMAIEEMKEIEG